MLGASPARCREVELPILRGVRRRGGVRLAISLGEFGATVFIARTDRPTLPVAIFRFLGRPGAENAGTARALSVVLMALVIDGRARVATGARGEARVEALRWSYVDVTIEGEPIVDDVSLDVGVGRAPRAPRSERRGQVDAPVRRRGAQAADGRTRACRRRRPDDRARASARDRARVPGRRAVPPSELWPRNVGFGPKVAGLPPRGAG